MVMMMPKFGKKATITIAGATATFVGDTEYSRKNQ
jgi:hypothetical protein